MHALPIPQKVTSCVVFSHAVSLSVLLILRTGRFGFFIWERDPDACIELARTVAVNTLVKHEICYRPAESYSARTIGAFFARNRKIYNS